MPPPRDSNQRPLVLIFFNIYVQVIARVNKPFFAKVTCGGKECPDDYDGPKYEGFSVDLVDNIVQMLNKDEGKHYEYEFLYDPTMDYGEYDDKTKKWTGLIGQLLDKVVFIYNWTLTIRSFFKFIAP